MFIKTDYTGGESSITANKPYYVERADNDGACHIISDTGSNLYVLLGKNQCAHLGLTSEWVVCITGMSKETT